MLTPPQPPQTRASPPLNVFIIRPARKIFFSCSAKSGLSFIHDIVLSQKERRRHLLRCPSWRSFLPSLLYLLSSSIVSTLTHPLQLFAATHRYTFTMSLIDEFRSGNFSLYGQWYVASQQHWTGQQKRTELRSVYPIIALICFSPSSLLPSCTSRFGLASIVGMSSQFLGIFTAHINVGSGN